MCDSFSVKPCVEQFIAKQIVKKRHSSNFCAKKTSKMKQPLKGRKTVAAIRKTHFYKSAL